MRSRTQQVVFSVLFVLIPVACAAQEQGAPASSDPGAKLVLGGSVGLGNSSPDLCKGCRPGLAIGLHGGAMLTPKLALQAEALFLSVAPNVLSKNGGKHDALVGTVQSWPTRRFWVKGGAGVGSVERHTPEASSRITRPAGIAGAGIDFNPGARFLLDLSVLALVTGDSRELFADEPAHKSAVMTPLLRFGVTWRAR